MSQIYVSVKCECCAYGPYFWVSGITSKACDNCIHAIDSDTGLVKHPNGMDNHRSICHE